MAKKMIYANYINFNWDGGKVLSFKNFNGIFNHIVNNKNRLNGQELLNKNPLDDLILRNYTKEQRLKDKNAFKNNCRKCDKPYRSLVAQLNVEPTKENLEIIKEWANNVLELMDKNYNVVHAQVHMNETRPGIHFIVLNMNQERTKYGNYNKNNEKVKITGEYYLDKNNNKIEIESKTKNEMKKKDKNFKTYRFGKEVFENIWKEGEEINRQLAEKYNLDFVQEPTTDKGFARKYEDMNINDFRKHEGNLLNSFGAIEISKQPEVREFLNETFEMNSFLEEIGYGKGKTLVEKFKNLIKENENVNKLFNELQVEEKMKQKKNPNKNERER